MVIPNGCRYCEGFCAVSPTMELRRVFAPLDLKYLANLCHFHRPRFSPRGGGVSVRTSNRNFEGRLGTKDARVLLTGLKATAVAALGGRLVEPRSQGMACSKLREPKAYVVGENMFIFPEPEMGDTPISRGPNIGSPPQKEEIPDSLGGKVMLKLGDKVVTHHITPAGPRLKHRSNIAHYSQFVLENMDPTFPTRCLENKARGIHNLIVPGDSYGQGPSKEHAAICTMFLGVKAVIAKSFEKIPLADLVNFGILPFLFKEASRYEVVGHGGDGISLRFKSSALDFPKDLASGGHLPPPSVGLSLASGERVSPRSKSWKIKAPAPSRSEKRHHPVIAYHTRVLSRGTLFPLRSGKRPTHPYPEPQHRRVFGGCFQSFADAARAGFGRGNAKQDRIQ